MSNYVISLKKTLLKVVAVLAMGVISSVAYAAVSASNANFTMLGGSSAVVGGTNDVEFTWDGTLNDNVSTATSNATISSATAFFGINWTAYNVKIFAPGSYTIPTVDTGFGPGCPTVDQAHCASAGDYTVTVPSGRIMAHMKFAWGGTEGIDVVNVWAPGDWTVLNPIGSGPNINKIFTGDGGTYAGPVYSLVSTDWNNDGIAGAGMIDGPFPAFKANFSMNTGGSVTLTCPPNCPPPETNVTAPSTGGGCSISTASANPVEQGEWWLLAGFLAWLGAFRMRLKRQAQS